jgi:uncharacterized RDD family membrane protein YckC
MNHNIFINDNPYSAPQASIASIESLTDDPLVPAITTLDWRLFAFFADYFIFICLMAGSFAVVTILLRYERPGSSTSSHTAGVVDYTVTRFCAFVAWIVYFAAQESSRWQATLGKRLFKLRVVTLDNSRITFAGASARAFLKLVGLAAFFLGIIPALFTRRRQTLHDLVSRTVVVRGPHKGTSKV